MDQLKAATGTWTLTAPDGTQWTGDSPLRAVAAERDSRVPAGVQAHRVMAMLNEMERSTARLFYWEETEDAWVPAGELEVCNIVDVVCLDEGEEIEIRFKRLDMTQAELDALPEA